MFIKNVSIPNLLMNNLFFENLFWELQIPSSAALILSNFAPEKKCVGMP